MKVVFDRERLIKDLQLVKQVISKQTIKPILMYGKLLADKGILLATDLEVGIRHKVKCLVIEGGEGLLPISNILHVIKDCKDREITITADDGACEIIAAKGSFKLPSDDPKNFPDVPDLDEKNYCEVDAAVLRDMVKKTIFSTATEHARYALVGLLWDVDDKLKLVGTDGRRLSIAEGPCKGNINSKGKTWVVPTKAIELLCRCLPSGKSGGFMPRDNSVRASFRENDVIFKMENTVVLSRLVEGRYPPYKEIISENKPVVSAELTVGPFLDGLKQVSFATDDIRRHVVLSFSDGKVEMKGENDSGQAAVVVNMPCDGAMTVKLDAKYLMEMLRVFSSKDKLAVGLYAADRPVLFRHNSWVHILLTIH